MFLGNYSCITISISSALSKLASFILLIQLVNGAQFLKITCLLFLSAAIAAASFPCPTTVKFLLTSLYASL